MIQNTLERTRRMVWPKIRKYLQDPLYPPQFSIPKKYDREVSLYWKINREYSERKGKYLRPTLVILIAEALGLPTEKAIKTAAAMQLSEDWILIHDDVEDGSDERRGKPTLHKMYGEELAINAGDSIHIIMWKVIQDVGSSKIANEFYRMLLRTALGQGVEQIWTNRKKGAQEDGYFFIADGKSAYYSITGPMRLGAMIAGATEKEVEKITDFGLHLGRCFQLVDDLIDIEQDRSEGKATLATVKGVKYIRKIAKMEKEQAGEIFDKELKFLSREPARTRLKELIDFILERKY